MVRVSVEVGPPLARRLGAGGSRSWERNMELAAGATLTGALAALASAEPPFGAHVCDGEQLRSGVLLLVNGKIRTWSQVSQREAADGDRITFYPMIGGG